MERKDICSVGDVLRQAIEENDMTGRLNELKAASAWPVIIGKEIAALTLKPFVKNGNMTIRVADAGLRQELTMQRSRLIAEFNRITGAEVIKSLRFTS